MRARVSVKLNATRTQIHIFIVLLVTHIAQQPRQHGQVNLLIAGWLWIQLPSMFGHCRVQLRVRIAPLSHASNVDEVLAQKLLVLTVAEFVLRTRRRFATARF